nr:4637_t:CDS:10 [Entrophospora candida]
MEYKISTNLNIDAYFSNQPISKWHRFDAYIIDMLKSNPIITPQQLHTSFCKSLSVIENNQNGGCPKYVLNYATKLRKAVKKQRKTYFIDLAEKLVERTQRENLMQENKIDIQQKQDSDAFMINLESNDNYEIENMMDFKHVFTWDHVIPKMQIQENSLKDFRQFQMSTIENLKIDPVLSYTTDVESILALSSIMMLRKNRKSIYISCTDEKWQAAFPRIVYKFRMPPLVQSVICSYTQHLMNNEIMELEDLWRQNWSKISILENQQDKKIFDSMQLIARNFKNLSDEDTYIHKTCHMILEEIFRIETMQLVCESISSKTQCAKEGVIHGKKPDFRLLCKHGNEILFGEAKPPRTANCKAITNQALIKLATFMKDSLDIGAHDETYGIIVNAAEFLVILNVMERCYELKEMILETEQRRRKKNILLNTNYQRDTNSSPAKTKVPIICAHAL